VVPLLGVNRAFVQAGLARIVQLKRPGIGALAAIAKLAPPFTSYHLGFMLGPRINAGGRVGKCSLGAELLHTRDTACAGEIATLLDLHNRERQSIEKAMLVEAIEAATLQTNSAFILASKEGWHSGVVGIVAGRLKDRFLKPAFVVGFEGGLGRGSARSISGRDIGALVRLAHDRKIIDAGGGHAMAAGFSLRASQLDGFRAFLVEEFLRSDVVGNSGALEIDTIVSPRGATPALVDEMTKAGPFGAGNPEPLVGVTDARVVFAETVGQDHVRLRLAGSDGARLDAIAFRAAGLPLGKALLGARGRPIHAVGHLRCDEWQGRKRVQLRLEDAALADG
jgi:single-stranded-DNA-specific exonuclease